MARMINTLYSWYGKTAVRIIFASVVVLIIASLVTSFFRGGEQVLESDQEKRMVRTASVAELVANGSSVSIIGTVEAVDRAEVRSETGGRITSVSVSIGDRVAAGSVLATFENSSQSASVLQAQGAYEAALAAAEQSRITANASLDSLASVNTAAWNTYRNAFIATDDVMRNTMDALFSDYNRQILNLSEFFNERRAIRYELDDWNDESIASQPTGDVTPYIVESEILLNRFVRLVDSIYTHLTRMERADSNTSTLTLITQYKSELSTVRSSLNSAQTSLTTAKTQIENAQSAYERAQIAGSGGSVSAADAQVKQALGSLRLAQSALEKTIVRAPIAGVVNSVSVSRGEFVGQGSIVAQVLNNDAFVITAFLSETDRARIAINDTVSLSDGSTGVVTNISPSVTQATQKYEVKISPTSDSFSNGDVVRIMLDGSVQTEDGSPTTLYLPLSAVKLTSSAAEVFTVSDEGILEAHAVTLGGVRGNAVAVESGITPEMEIVADARGLSAGAAVDVVQ